MRRYLQEALKRLTPSLPSNYLRRATLVFTLTSAAIVGAAQPSLYFSNLTTREGLPSNIISAVAQDQNDFIWIGTANGLCRFDGYRFTTFKKQDTKNALPANQISSLLVIDNYLWIGTWKGLCRLNTTTFEIEQIDLGQNNVIRTLYRDKQNVVWIGTATGLIRYENKHARVYNSENSNLSHNTVRSVLSDRFGNLWVGTYDKLNKLAPGKNRFVSYDLKGSYKPSLKNNLICDIKQDVNSDSLLWIGTETGLCHLNITNGSFKHYSEKEISLSNEVIKNIFADENGVLWLGTDFGLNVFNPKAKSTVTYFHNPQHPYAIANNVIWQVVEDNGGVIWFVTSNGLSRISKFRNYYFYHEVAQDINGQRIGNQVKSALVSTNGVLWLATLHGVLRIDSKSARTERFDTRSTPARRILLNNVYAIEEDHFGRIWIGTAGGINVWDEQTQRMYAITSSGNNGLVTNYISKFTKGVDGSLWVSAWEGGLFKVTGDQRNINDIRFERAGDYGSEKNVSGSNAIWAIDYDELHRIDLSTHRDTKVNAFNSLSKKNGVSCLYFSRKGSLWAGTVNGLIEYKPQSDSAILHPITTGNDINLASINEDRHGNIWGTTNGLVIKYNLKTQLVEFFPLDNDLPIKSFFDGCSATTADGEIIFGGDNGYITLQPEIKINDYDPKVYITALKVNNENVSPVSENKLVKSDIAFVTDLSVNYQQRSLTFEFSALHHWQPSRNVYAYKLKGFDTDWNYVSGLKNFAVYSNLNPGVYTFTVKATNNHGIWSDQLAKMSVTVHPPLFLSTPFIIGYILIGFIFTFVALRIYTTRLHLKNEVKIVRLEKDHAEEIAFTKQQFFTNISHELRTPISLILPPIQQTLKRESLDKESRSLLKLAEKNSQRLLRVVNQILDFRKLEHDSLELKITSFDLIEFCRELHVLFSDKAARNEIHFTFHPSVNSCRIWADMEKIETVLYNLLSNAFKFTPRHGSIDVSISVKQADQEFLKGSVQIKISDTGIGVAREEQKKIFDRFYQTKEAKQIESGSGIGLTLAAEYTRMHSGTINVSSNIGQGSCFTVTLPLGGIHFPIDGTPEDETVNIVAAKRTNDQQYQYDITSEKPLILLVEDNSEMIEFLKINLGEKYHLVTAENGEDALQKANSFPPELIISDIMMPVMDGLTLCKRIKENPKTAHVGIILLTAKSLTSQKVEGIKMGADAYITKPFEMDILEASIAHLLKRKQELADYFKSELLTQPSTTHSENEDDKFVKKVMNIVEANISNPQLSVEMLSDEIGMSATHLYRKLKSLTHLSGNEIIKRYRIKKASLLLKNKEGNITEIMYEVGFSSLSYFSKCFKAEFGLSPKDYQQRMSKAPNSSVQSDLSPTEKHGSVKKPS